MELYGWLAARNLNIGCLGETEDFGDFVQYNHLLNKFPDDRVSVADEKQVCFLDGYLFNKEEFINEKEDKWQDIFAQRMGTKTKECLQGLRGGFYGYHYNKLTKELIIYTDHTANKVLFYYVKEDSWMVSSSLLMMVKVLKANNICYHFNETAAKYIMTYGFMLDDSTYVKEIHRLLNGNYLKVSNNEVSMDTYYRLHYSETEMTRKEAVERIDRAFRKAVEREFRKDLEYGYRHLVDLSGGLDSRMVAVVADDLGFTDQLNVTYSQLQYTDATVSGEIARDLGHEYLFKALDDALWMYDVDEMVIKSNGASGYMAMTGGNRLLKSLNLDDFGIEHTGMLGDVIISSYYHDKTLAYQTPQYGYNQYSQSLSYEFDEELLHKFDTQELFTLNTRGILGMQVSYMIRQNYIETASPFTDVDFLDTVLSIPFEYRAGHSVYLQWIAEKYPKAAEYGWEKWGGVKPKMSHLFFRKVRTTQRLAHIWYCKMRKIPNRDNMNPEDYWFQNNEKIQKYIQSLYENRIGNTLLSSELREDLSRLFLKGDITDKNLALTVLGAAHLFF